jgi:hypothetical protein
MRKQVKIWVMIADPEGETRTVPFTAKTIEKCMEHLQLYLDTYTSAGTRAEVVQSGYIYTGASINGVQRKNSRKRLSTMETE